MVIDVEKEFATAIQAIGGKRVSSLVGRAPGFENADFIFEAAGIVAELKCLDEDKICDEGIIEKASKLYLEELKAQRAPVIAFGTNRLTTTGFTKDYWEKIGSLYRIPIERVVRKADRQIQETMAALSRPTDRGLLILANNNHSAIDPWHAKYILDEILGQPGFGHIHSALFFTANQKVALPGVAQHIDCWIEIRRNGVSPIEEGFLQTLRDAWYKHLARLFGLPEPNQSQIDSEFLARLENRPRE